MPMAVVTGANRGIGLGLCRKLKAKGYSVVGACRKSSNELDALGVTVVSGVDVTEEGTLEALKTAVGDANIDILIHNAGVFDHPEGQKLESLDFSSVTFQFDVNALGPLRTTKALLGNLGRGSKIAIITSRMGSIADNSSGGYYGYRMSKAAVNMAGMSLARDLTPKGIAVAILHPGMVATDMTLTFGHDNCITVDQSVDGLIGCIDRLSMDTTGIFQHSNGQTLPW